MKITQIRVLCLLGVVLFSGNVSGVSIVYRGFECQNTVNANDPTPTDTSVQSRFEVIEEVGGGMFRLSLTGGLPRFIDGNLNVCIDSDTAIGFSGIPAANVLPKRLDAIDATAYFNGQDLIIIVSSINTDLTAARGTFNSFTTSRIFPFSNTLIFEQNPQASFKLKKIVHNRGFVLTTGSTNTFTPLFETVLPSFGDTEQEEGKPEILTPVANIEYILE